MAATPSPEGTVYQANFKIGNDLFNIYATNGGEFSELLDLFAEEHVAKIASIQQTIGGVSTVTASVPVAPAPQQPAPQRPVAQPAGGEPLCDCGIPMKLIPAGVSKATGKPYKGFYACSQPRELQCAKKISV